MDDRRHLVHVLARVVHERIIGVETPVAHHDREVPVVLEQVEDRLALLGGPTVDQLTLVVVAELHVLDLAERLQRVVPALGLAVGDPGADEVSEPDDDQEDSE